MARSARWPKNLLAAGWQSGYAAACKAVYAGSIPASASIELGLQPSSRLRSLRPFAWRKSGHVPWHGRTASISTTRWG